MSAKIFTVANQKGGVAKTTTVASILSYLASRGKRTLGIDFDSQGQVATALGISQSNNVFNFLVTGQSPSLWVQSTGRENLSIIPGDRMTSTAQIVMNAENRPLDAVASILKSIRREYDYIVFDTAPSVGGLQERAIWASDFVLIPTATEFMSSDGLTQILAMIRNLEEKGWPGNVAGILPTFYDQQTRESQETLAELRKAFGELCLPPIHRATVLRECAAEGVTIFEKDPKSRAAEEYTALAEYLLKL